MQNRNKSDLVLRKASVTDKDIILDWRNDEGTRKASFNTNPVSHEDHDKWFLSSLNDPNRIIYVAEEYGKATGMVRLDKINDKAWEISVNVAPSSRGKGLGSKIISAACESFSLERNSVILIARTKGANIASEKVFIGSGFCNLTSYKDADHEEIKLLGRII